MPASPQPPGRRSPASIPWQLGLSQPGPPAYPPLTAIGGALLTARVPRLRTAPRMALRTGMRPGAGPPGQPAHSAFAGLLALSTLTPAPVPFMASKPLGRKVQRQPRMGFATVGMLKGAGPPGSPVHSQFRGLLGLMSLSPAPVPFNRSMPSGRVVPRQPRMQLRPGMTPGAVAVVTPVRPVTLTVARRAVRAAPSRITNGARVPPLAVQPLTLARRPRLVPARRGAVSGPLAPGAVAVVTPVRPVILATSPRRGPPPLRPGRLAAVCMPPPVRVAVVTAVTRRGPSTPRPGRVTAGMLPGHGLSGIPVPHTRFPYRLVRRPAGTLRPGMLPGAGLSGIPPSGFVRSRPAPSGSVRSRSRVVPGFVQASPLVSLVIQRVLSRPLSRPLSGRLTTGQRGSLTVPVPVPAVVRSRQRVRPVPSRLVPSPYAFVPGVYPPVSAPARFARPQYRLVRQPPQHLVTGMLPGKGLSGLPPATFLRSRPGQVQRQPRSLSVAGRVVPPPVAAWLLRSAPGKARRQARIAIASGTVVPPVLAFALRGAVPRRARLVASRIAPGTVAAAVSRVVSPATLAGQRSRPVKVSPSRLVMTRYVVPAVVYPPVASPTRLTRTQSRLARRLAGYLGTGMLPGAPAAPAAADGTVTWTAAAAAPRWRAYMTYARWTIQPANPRWRITMANFLPIAALSLEEVNVTWASDLDGTSIDPTGQTAGQLLLPVQMAFPVSSGNPALPAEPVTWLTAAWLLGGTGKGYVAQCLIGPGGGVVTLSAGVTYDVWSKITGSPEIPAKYAGSLSVY